jgi:hypothetical protein
MAKIDPIYVLGMGGVLFRDGLLHSGYHFVPRVEAGKNTSAVIPANRKRRRKGNPVVSGETVTFGYESSATLTTDRLHYKLQISPLIREDRILPT